MCFLREDNFTVQGDNMEDHSLRGYLQRRTTEELESMLIYCVEGKNYIKYELAILEILKILRQRDASRGGNLPPVSD